MSKMSDVHISICEMLESGLYDDARIAAALEIPVEWVTSTRESFEEDDRQPDEAQEWYDFDPDC